MCVCVCVCVCVCGRGSWDGGGEGLHEDPVRFSLNDSPTETAECMWVNIWCMPDWIIGFCCKTAGIHFLGISCSTFSLFTFDLENSTLSAYVKLSLENNFSNLPISIGVVIKITVYIYSIKSNFMKALFSFWIRLYCLLPKTNWFVCYHQKSSIVHCAGCKK